MPPPYDAVISIGGQSLVDGVWHLFGPALEELSNPLPLALIGAGIVSYFLVKDSVFEVKMEEQPKLDGELVANPAD